MKVIERMRDVNRAQIIVGYLRANGVDARLLDAEMSRIIPGVGGVRIAVPEDEENRAKWLLSQIEENPGAMDV